MKLYGAHVTEYSTARTGQIVGEGRLRGYPVYYVIWDEPLPYDAPNARTREWRDTVLAGAVTVTVHPALAA